MDATTLAHRVSQYEKRAISPALIERVLARFLAKSEPALGRAGEFLGNVYGLFRHRELAHPWRAAMQGADRVAELAANRNLWQDLVPATPSLIRDALPSRPWPSNFMQQTGVRHGLSSLRSLTETAEHDLSSRVAVPLQKVADAPSGGGQGREWQNWLMLPGIPLAKRLGNSAAAAAKRTTPSFLDLGRAVWLGPEAASVAQAAKLTPEQASRISELFRSQPLRAKLSLLGIANFPGLSPETSHAVRQLTFNTPATSRMGDTLVKIPSRDVTNAMTALQNVIAGTPFSSAGFDVGPAFRLPDSPWGNTGSVQSLTPNFGNGPSTTVYRHQPAELVEHPETVSTIRLRPTSPVTAEDIARATPQINQLYGGKIPFNTAELHRIQHREMLGENGVETLQRITDWLRQDETRMQRAYDWASRLGLGDAFRKVRLPYVRPGTGKVCSTAAAEALRAVSPGAISAEVAMHASPQDLLRQMGKTFDVAGVNLGERFSRPAWLAANEAFQHGPVAIRAIPAVALGAAGMYGARQLSRKYLPQVGHLADMAMNTVKRTIDPALAGSPLSTGGGSTKLGSEEQAGVKADLV